uniref:RNA polymerase II elongation factor ELL2-like n=1 Tax=Jaculus jaculus TaxID=51337 RepID=UPI001E1B4916|nr:RNA polymerase II elongation factor ELL2-like [Jaculus jaculus]
MVRQEEQVSVKETDSPETGQDNVNRLPMNLPRAAIQAGTPYQFCKHSLSSQVPQLQGLKRFSTLSPKNSFTDLENFSFPLLNVSNDNYQDKLCSSQLTLSSTTSLHLRYLQSIEKKKALSRATASSEMNSARMTQIEEKPCNTWRNMIKSNTQKKKVPIGSVPHFLPDPVPVRKKIDPVNPTYTIQKARVVNSINTRLYRERVIHLLALKDYKKSELLIKLQKDDSKLNDSNLLGKILLQVANLNATTLSYSLKNCMFKEVQRDWPGYNEQDKHTLDLMLSQKLGKSYNATKDINHLESPVVPSADNKLSTKDHTCHFPGTDYLMKNKSGLCPLKSAMKSTSESQLSSSKSEKPAILPSSSVIGKSVPPSLPTSDVCISNPSLLMKSNHNIYSAPEKPGTQPLYESIDNDDSIFDGQPNKYISLEAPSLISHQTKYCKPMESQYVMTEKFPCAFTKGKMMSLNYKTNMMEKQKLDSKKQEEGTKLNPSKLQKSFSVSGKTNFPTVSPDCFANYFTIVSSEQRQRYERDFKIDYNEYKGICDKIQFSCKEITKLDTERKTLSPNSKNYQDITKKISVEYQKMRQINPNFSAEKRRCAYLYNKLSHIRKLINDFDEKQQVKSKQ